MLFVPTIVWLIVLFALVLLCAAIPCVLTTALFAVVLLVPIAVLAVNAVIGMRQLVHTHIDMADASEKGVAHPWTITLSNAAAVPLGNVMFLFALSNLLTGAEFKESLYMGVPSRGSNRALLQITSEHSGVLQAHIDRIWLRGPLGILAFPCRVHCADSCTVTPSMFDVAVRVPMALNPDADTERYSATIPGNDLSEVFQVREYQPGDSPKQIHWKLSAKLDRIITRDPSLPIDRSLILFWEQHVPERLSRADVLDAQVETIITLCRSLVQQGVTCTLCMCAKPEDNAPEPRNPRNMSKKFWLKAKRPAEDAFELVRLTVETEDQLYEACSKLLISGGLPAGASSVNMYTSLYGAVRDEHVIVVCSEEPGGLDALCTAHNRTVLVVDSADYAQGLSEVCLY